MQDVQSKVNFFHKATVLMWRKWSGIKELFSGWRYDDVPRQRDSNWWLSVPYGRVRVVVARPISAHAQSEAILSGEIP